RWGGVLSTTGETLGKKKRPLCVTYTISVISALVFVFSPPQPPYIACFCFLIGWASDVQVRRAREFRGFRGSTLGNSVVVTAVVVCIYQRTRVVKSK
ncbi:hypothetical protein F5X99DRAFT_371719, partial [Biscogniauxia marginata]